MFNLQAIVPKYIRELNPYRSARDEFNGEAQIYLDANENPFGELNRYPDPQQKFLKNKLSITREVSSDQLFIGNGSDEIIDLTFRVFCEAHKDKALICDPTYGMYEVGAAINNIELLRVPLRADFSLDVDQILVQCQDESLKLIFICTPNNPTGNSFGSDAIHKIITSFDGIVFIDEAYIDFSEHDSWVNYVNQYTNLIVCQTMSKAWGLAAARIGIGYAQRDIINLFNKIKPPYNVSDLNQQAALQALNNRDIFIQKRERIICERRKMMSALANMSVITEIHESEANFILVQTINSEKIYLALQQEGIIVRLKKINNQAYLRISIGNEVENKSLLRQLNRIIL